MHAQLDGIIIKMTNSQKASE